jgi:hypothetical protein
MARRPTILTKQVMADIPAMIADGMGAAAIAEKFGCNLGTLKVRCSQAGISLRTTKDCRLTISPAIMMGLREYANAKGLHRGQAGDRSFESDRPGQTLRRRAR